MILLWLLCAGATGQEPCRSPGDFPSPKLSLSTSSAQVGDSVSAQCSLPLNILAALVIFCQDDKQISSQLATPGQELYRYDISVPRTGQFRCMYQYRNDKNQVQNSRLSLPQTLNITDRRVRPGDTVHSNRSSSSEEKSNPEGGQLGPEVIAGIAGFSVLSLASLLYLLVKKAASRRRGQREQLPDRSTENIPTDEQIHYAAINKFGKVRHPQPQETETATYAAIGKARGRPS